MAFGPVCGAVRGPLLMGALFYMVAWFRLHPTHRVDALRGRSLLDLVGNEPTAGGTAGASAEHSATTSTVAQVRSPGDGDGIAFATNHFAVGGADRERPGSAGDAQPLALLSLLHGMQQMDRCAIPGRTVRATAMAQTRSPRSTSWSTQRPAVLVASTPAALVVLNLLALLSLRC